ncbi:MAG: hypothetical protein M3P98_02905 [bacterium]|nr:hypothetical protein [bacterium]MDQ3159057.1 hypothetical protein [bacterium]
MSERIGDPVVNFYNDNRSTAQVVFDRLEGGAAVASGIASAGLFLYRGEVLENAAKIGTVAITVERSDELGRHYMEAGMGSVALAGLAVGLFAHRISRPRRLFNSNLRRI